MLPSMEALHTAQAAKHGSCWAVNPGNGKAAGPSELLQHASTFLCIVLHVGNVLSHVEEVSSVLSLYPHQSIDPWSLVAG
jgi:hypothetical protein